MKPLVVLLVLAVAAVPSFAEVSAAEQQKIEKLLAAVETMRDATFVRNGKAYKAATAAKFLRAKWEDRARDVRSAEEFIEKIATSSSTTGKPYLIRFAGGREVPVADFLRERLRG